MVSSVTSAGRAGSWIAGPRVRVRRGRRAKLPDAAVSNSSRFVCAQDLVKSYQSAVGLAHRGRRSGRPGGAC
jgi:hypothetical protein